MAKGKGCNDPSERVDDCGNPAVGGTNQGQPLFDSANLRLLEMLVGAKANAKPGIVGQVQEPARALSLRNRLTGENNFVANERQHVGCSWNRDRSSLLARQKPAWDAGELRQAGSFE